MELKPFSMLDEPSDFYFKDQKFIYKVTLLFFFICLILLHCNLFQFLDKALSIIRLFNKLLNKELLYYTEQ